MGEVRRELHEIKEGVEELAEELLPASEGAGPLLQRDYWAVVRESRLSPPEIGRLLRERFQDFPPEALCAFRRADGSDSPLEVGDRVDIKITAAGPAAVRVVHVDENSLTLGTLKGHPEAGIITFGAYRNRRGDVVFHIRSRARASSAVRFAGFLAAGEPMQATTWTDFIDRLAHMVGEGVIGPIHAETRKVEDDEVADAMDSPTFIAKGE